MKTNRRLTDLFTILFLTLLIASVARAYQTISPLEDHTESGPDLWYPLIFAVFVIYGVIEIYILNREEEKKKKRKWIFLTSKKPTRKGKKRKK